MFERPANVVPPQIRESGTAKGGTPLWKRSRDIFRLVSVTEVLPIGKFSRPWSRADEDATGKKLLGGPKSYLSGEPLKWRRVHSGGNPPGNWTRLPRVASEKRGANEAAEALPCSGSLGDLASVQAVTW